MSQGEAMHDFAPAFSIVGDALSREADVVLDVFQCESWSNFLDGFEPGIASFSESFEPLLSGYVAPVKLMQ